jgi:hypothetical protein
LCESGYRPTAERRECVPEGELQQEKINNAIELLLRPFDFGRIVLKRNKEAECEGVAWI